MIDVAAEHGVNEVAVDLLAATGGRQQGERQRLVGETRCDDRTEGMADDMQFHRRQSHGDGGCNIVNRGCGRQGFAMARQIERKGAETLCRQLAAQAW